jgi:signal transduction histidine kinase
VVVEVADEGAGVPDELAGRIFEREVTSGAGTGLGLALARDLANADGGRLELAQRRPAVFALFLSGVPASMRPDVVLPLGAVVSARPDRRRR